MTRTENDLEVLGLISTQYASETHAAAGPGIDKTYLGALALAHENGNFDRVLIGYHSSAPDGFQVAAYAATKTTRLKFLLAHRPGFVAPTLAARQLNRAQRILQEAKDLKERGTVSLFRAAKNESTGSQRLQQTANGGAIRDKRLWTEIAKLTGAQGNSTSLVGTPEQVVEALLDYCDLGINKFLFRGFDPLEDAIDYGRNLLPLLREAVAKRERPRIAAAG